MQSELSFLKLMFENAPIIGVIVTAVILILVAVARAFGLATIVGNGSKLVDDGKLAAVTTGVAEINTKLATIDKRITTVEHEIESRPTRQEIHALDIAMVKLDGRMGAFEENMKAVRHTVNRIDDFLLAISERGIRDGGRQG